MNSNMLFDWHYAYCFLIVAETGSLSSAAKRIGISQPTLGRNISNLEEQLSMTLFHRSTQGLSLTQSGRQLLIHVKEMHESANKASLLAAGTSKDFHGRVCISATEWFATTYLPKFIKKMRGLYSNLCIEVVSTNELTDLRKQDADIAIRNGRPTEPDLIARKVGIEYYGFYASQDYLESIEFSDESVNWKSIDFIGFHKFEQLASFLSSESTMFNNVNISAMANNTLANCALIKQGIGVGIVSNSHAKNHPDLIKILDKYPLPKSEIWLVSHQALQTSVKFKAIYDHLAQFLIENMHNN